LSYEIIYGKQFVKLRRTGEVIPMLLAGSNNCFDIGRGGRNGRRARDWSNDRYYNRKGKISEKPDVILNNLDAELRRRIRDRYDKEDKPADIRNSFGYYASVAVGGGRCGDTSWNKYRGQYVNGIRGALTVEELENLGVHLYFHDVGMVGDSPNGRPAQVDITTEQQYFIELKKWRAWQAEKGKGFWLSFHPHNDEVILKRLREPKRKTPREKTRVEQDHYFVLTDGHNGLLKYTSRGYRYSFSKGSGKRFRSEKEAESYRQGLLKKNRYKADIWKVERIDATAVFLV